MVFLYRNGLFSGRGAPRAIVSFSVSNAEERTMVNAVHVRVLLPRPVRVQAGQYINLWMPSVSLCSWMQTHPFTVVSWSKGKQDTMELLVKPRRGLTADLARYAPTDERSEESSISFLALITGPHGLSEEIGHYESILLLASGCGVAGAIPYLKKAIYGYNTCTSQIRRLHLVWQVESIDEMSAALTLLNRLLKDDIVDGGYVGTGSTRETPSEADNIHGSRYCTSLFTSGMALAIRSSFLGSTNESFYTRDYQITKA